MAMATAMAETLSSPASNCYVFSGFRGEDTRYGFIGHLYKFLTDKGIHISIDNEKLPRGGEITPALVKAIHGSMNSMIVPSKIFASSSFCIDELVTIIGFKSEELVVTWEELVVTWVFYMVDPSYCRHQKGSYRDALAKHEKRFKHSLDKFKKWMETMHPVADLSGYHI